jgi:hypothetical protein
MQETRITVNRIFKKKDWRKEQQSLTEKLNKELRKTLKPI